MYPRHLLLMTSRIAFSWTDFTARRRNARSYLLSRAMAARWHPEKLTKFSWMRGGNTLIQNTYLRTPQERKEHCMLITQLRCMKITDQLEMLWGTYRLLLSLRRAFNVLINTTQSRSPYRKHISQFTSKIQASTVSKTTILAHLTN